MKKKRANVEPSKPRTDHLYKRRAHTSCCLFVGAFACERGRNYFSADGKVAWGQTLRNDELFVDCYWIDGVWSVKKFWTVLTAWQTGVKRLLEAAIYVSYKHIYIRTHFVYLFF